MQAIQYDLRKQLRERLVPVGLCAGFFLLFLLLFIKMIQLKEPIVFQLGFALLFLLILTIVLSIGVYKWYYALNSPGCIVKDRLIRKEIKYRYRRYRSNEFCFLHFASYGGYEVPDENYDWSDLHSMDDNMVYIHAECDDEFYLVLSKPHTGKILLASNAKMFDYQPPQS